MHFLHFKSLIEILNLIGKYSIPRTLRCRVLSFFGDARFLQGSQSSQGSHNFVPQGSPKVPTALLQRSYGVPTILFHKVPTTLFHKVPTTLPHKVPTRFPQGFQGSHQFAPRFPQLCSNIAPRFPQRCSNVPTSFPQLCCKVPRQRFPQPQGFHNFAPQVSQGSHKIAPRFPQLCCKAPPKVPPQGSPKVPTILLHKFPTKRPRFPQLCCKVAPRFPQLCSKVRARFPQLCCKVPRSFPQLCPFCFKVPTRFPQLFWQGKVPTTLPHQAPKVPTTSFHNFAPQGSSKVPTRFPPGSQGSCKVPARFLQGSQGSHNFFPQGSPKVPQLCPTRFPHKVRKVPTALLQGSHKVLSGSFHVTGTFCSTRPPLVGKRFRSVCVACSIYRARQQYVPPRTSSAAFYRRVVRRVAADSRRDKEEDNGAEQARLVFSSSDAFARHSTHVSRRYHGGRLTTLLQGSQKLPTTLSTLLQGSYKVPTTFLQGTVRFPQLCPTRPARCPQHRSTTLPHKVLPRFLQLWLQGSHEVPTTWPRGSHKVGASFPQGSRKVRNRQSRKRHHTSSLFHCVSYSYLLPC